VIQVRDIHGKRDGAGIRFIAWLGNARGLYRLTGDGSTVEKRQGDRRSATGA